MSDIVNQFSISIDQVRDFEFRVQFDKPQYAALHMDEGAPLGKDAAPSPARVLAAAVGNCLAASLLFCVRKHGLNPQKMRATVRTEIVRNEQRRLRVGKIAVEIDSGLDAAELEKAQACLPLFEDFCTVTAAVRDGIDVEVKVK
jgi:uncharacterized OsmC-like protein